MRNHSPLIITAQGYVAACSVGLLIAALGWVAMRSAALPAPMAGFYVSDRIILVTQAGSSLARNLVGPVQCFVFFILLGGLSIIERVIPTTRFLAVLLSFIALANLAWIGYFFPFSSLFFYLGLLPCASAASLATWSWRQQHELVLVALVALIAMVAFLGFPVPFGGF